MIEKVCGIFAANSADWAVFANSYGFCSFAVNKMPVERHLHTVGPHAWIGAAPTNYEFLLVESDIPKFDREGEWLQDSSVD